jgi:hypothetical protein
LAAEISSNHLYHLARLIKEAIMANGFQTKSGGSVNIHTLVACYSGLVFVVVSGGEMLVNGGAMAARMLLFGAIICALVGAVGMVLASFDLSWSPSGHSPGGGSPVGFPPPPWLPYAVGLTVCVIIIIGGAFYYAHSHREPNFLLEAGVASALAWGLSVVGALIWSSLGIVSSIYWNSWFNLFAAAFAALVVGYS